MKKLLIALLALLLALPPLTPAEEAAEEFASGDYEYILLEDGTARITGYTGSDTAPEIPAELDGRAVTAIGEKVFFPRLNLTSVTIPEGVTDIGRGAFEMHFSLTSVTLPDSLTSIGDGAFLSCGLTSVTLPDGVTAIGTNPFENCTALREIIVSPDHPCLAVVDGALLSRPDMRLVFVPYALLAETYAVPQGTAVIGDRAFSGYATLTSVTIPEGVIAIGDNAFRLCDLRTMVIPDGVTAIGKEAFHQCGSLASVTVPDSVTSIGEGAFSGCSRKLTLTVGRGSFAEGYCRDNGLAYTYPDGSGPNG